MTDKNKPILNDKVERAMKKYGVSRRNVGDFMYKDNLRKLRQLEKEGKIKPGDGYIDE